jgi:hypothetical protein
MVDCSLETNTFYEHQHMVQLRVEMPVTPLTCRHEKLLKEVPESGNIFYRAYLGRICHDISTSMSTEKT